MNELKVKVKEIKERCGAKLKVGDCFHVTGKGKVKIPDNKETCIYALGALIPFLTTKQMEEHLPGEEWVTETSDLACPDPKGVIFEITKL